MNSHVRESAICLKNQGFKFAPPPDERQTSCKSVQQMEQQIGGAEYGFGLNSPFQQRGFEAGARNSELWKYLWKRLRGKQGRCQ